MYIPKMMHASVLKNLTFFSIFYAIQAITYYVAFERGAGAGQLSAIVKSSIILTVLFAAIMLKERNDLGKKIISAIIMTLGVLLLR